MRWMGFTALGLAGCIVTGGKPMERDARDDRLSRQLSQQERWAQQALEARPTQDQLDRVRSGDQAAVNAGRKELTKLLQAIDRGTWIRDASSEMLQEDGDASLLRDFDQGGRLRHDAMQAADELASALADTRGGLDATTLQRALNTLQKAQASEEAIARQPVKQGQPRLAPAPLPTPRPFTDAAAKLAAGNPEDGKQLESALPPDEATKLRAKAADMAREQEEQKKAQQEEQQPPPPAMSGASGDVEAAAPSNTLNISNDVANLLAKKPPRSITLREDGLFELNYDDGAYLVDPDGKLVRKETPQQPQR